MRPSRFKGDLAPQTSGPAATNCDLFTAYLISDAMIDSNLFKCMINHEDSERLYVSGRFGTFCHSSDRATMRKRARLDQWMPKDNLLDPQLMARSLQR